MWEDYKKASGKEILKCFYNLAPFLNEIISADIGVTIYEGDTCILYVPSKRLNLNVRPGDKAPPGGATQTCIREKRKIVREFTKDTTHFGIPHIAIAYPVMEQDQVVGVVVTSETTDTLDIIRETSNHLENASINLSDVIEKLCSHSEDLVKSGKVLSSEVSDMIKMVKQTDTIINILNDVSRQTNLLGLNAAIEAARAGQSGRGFGIVAEEIRKLSRQSSESAKEINGLLKTIEEFIKNVSMQSQNVEKSVEKQLSSSQEIAASAQELSSIASKLKRYSEDFYLSGVTNTPASLSGR
jgi:hypothetical protein